MTDKHSNRIAEIEDEQAGLRESIAVTKELAERTDDLLQKYKARTDCQSANDDD